MLTATLSPGDEDRHLAAHLGITGVDGGPHRPHRFGAAAVTHMGKQIDRGVGDELDVVGAARQRGLDIAGIVDFEEIQHALPVKILGHLHFFSAGVGPDSLGSILNGMEPRSIGKRNQ